MEAYPSKYTTETQERDLKMKIPKPKIYEVDPTITTSTYENASSEAKSHTPLL